MNNPQIMKGFGIKLKNSSFLTISGDENKI